MMGTHRTCALAILGRVIIITPPASRMHNINFIDWKDFFTAAVSGTSALTGLVFVALSNNLTKILAMPGMVARGGEVLLQLGGALFIALIALIPGEPLWVLQLKFGVVSAAAWLLPLFIHVDAGKLGHFNKQWQFVLRALLHQLATLPFVAATVALFLAPEVAPYMLATGVMLSLAVGLFTAWILLVEIVR